jgi:hypothetical protein
MQLVVTYLRELIIVLDEIEDNLHGTLVDTADFLVIAFAQNVWSHHGCDVPRVHLVTRLFVDCVERGHPVEEAEQDLHRVAVGFRQQTQHEVKNLLSLVFFLNVCYC